MPRRVPVRDSLTSPRVHIHSQRLRANVAMLAASIATPGVMLASNATPAITPLKFVGFDNADGSRRRLALRDGWRLEGNLHTLGYFSGAHKRTRAHANTRAHRPRATSEPSPRASAPHCPHDSRGTPFVRSCRSGRTRRLHRLDALFVRQRAAASVGREPPPRPRSVQRALPLAARARRAGSGFPLSSLSLCARSEW